MRRNVMLFALSASAVTPTEKVVQMLQGMKAKGNTEMQQEKEAFEKFSLFCDDTATEKKYDIKGSIRDMSKYSTNIVAAREMIAQTSKKIAELQDSISVAEDEVKAANALRQREHADFLVALVDYEETLTAVASAISILRKQDYNRDQAEALLQTLTTMRRLPLGSAQALMNYFHGVAPEHKAKDAFLSAPEAFGKPKVAAYESHMGGVLDMLTEMQRKTSDQKATLEREEANKAHASQMMLQDLDSQINYDKKNLNQQESAKSAAGQKKAQNEGDLFETNEVKKADQAYLADLNTECSHKTKEFGERQKLRAEELVALDKAIEILSSDAVAGSAKKHLPTLVQVPHSFLQISASTALRQKTLGFLQQAARRLGSKSLALAATAAAEDPFAKVKTMVKDLIQRLQDEAKAEADHNAWCKKELKVNKLTRDEKKEAIAALTAKSDFRGASIAQNAEDITDLSAELAALETAMAKATEIRAEEKERNKATIADAVAAQDAVSKASVVLKEFYGKAAKATSFVQGAADDAPETWNSSFKGQQDEHQGVVGMLEVIQSDFARLQAETETEEAAAEAEYQKFTADSKEDHKQKYAKRLKIQREKVQHEFELHRVTKDLKANMKALDLANSTFQKLHKQCIATNLSYEDRVKKREEEIASLEQALTFLQDE